MTDESKSSSSNSVDISPGVAVYGMFQNFNYKPWLALGEFVDNSISSYQRVRSQLQALEGPEFKLQVSIQFDVEGDVLTVSDNAGGISHGDFGRAFALAVPPNDLRYINRYGVGMKSAACWFARQWSVRTSAIGEDVERTIEWRTEEIVSKSLRQIAPSSRPASANDHYTVLTLRDLFHPPSAGKTIAKIKEFLPNIYREFIRSGDLELRWNGELLPVQEPEVLVAAPKWDPEKVEQRWEQHFVLDMAAGQRISGRAFVLRRMKRSYTALNLFWHNRLILGNVEPNHRPSELFGSGNSFETGRLCVDLFMDDFEPTVDKMGFKFSDQEASLEEVIKVLKRTVPELLRQAREYREPRIDPEDPIPVIDPVIKKPAGDVVEVPASPTVSDPYPRPVITDPSPDDAKQLASIALNVDGVDWEIILRLGLTLLDTSFVKIEEEQASDQPVNRIIVTAGSRHPFVQRFWGSDEEVNRLLLYFASAIGFGEIAARRAGAKMPSHVRNNIDKFLLDVAARVAG